MIVLIGLAIEAGSSTTYICNWQEWLMNWQEFCRERPGEGLVAPARCVAMTAHLT